MLICSSSNYCTNTTFPAEAAKFQNHAMEEEEEDVYLQFLQQVLYEDDHAATGAAAAAAAAAVVPTPKKMKKDRHSKINTARGPRDRRMRLSLDIARRFFRLQDLLGYDKASTTVNWLLNNAAPAIADLLHDKPPPNSPINQQHSSSSSTNKMMMKKREKVKRRVAVGRESRKMARQRARERTSQKRRLILLPHDQQYHFNNSSSHLFTNYHQHSYFTQEEQEIQFGAWEAMGAINSFHPSEL